MSDRDAILEALTSVSKELGELRGEVKGVHERLDKINGRIGKNEDKVNAVLIHQAARSEACPLVDVLAKDIQPIRDFMTSHAATAAANKSWASAISPILYGAGLISVGLVLGHADMVSKFIGK